MASHFLLSAASRTLSLKAIYKGGEAAAYATFCKMRWPETDGEAICPKCGCCETYKITTRRKFKCKACGHQFSVTSGTIFASRKMDFVDLLAAICIIVNAAKGVSIVQLSRDLDCQYKTAFVLAHKLREAMAQEVQTGEALTGHVEIDGAYFGGHIRPKNLKADRVDLRPCRVGVRRGRALLRGLRTQRKPHANLRRLPRAAEPPPTQEGWQVRDLVSRLGGQLRIAPGAVIGCDISAALALGQALGVSPLVMAELLPGIEAVMVLKLNEHMESERS